jgi:hypothetical protein
VIKAHDFACDPDTDTVTTLEGTATVPAGGTCDIALTRK